MRIIRHQVFSALEVFESCKMLVHLILIRFILFLAIVPIIALQSIKPNLVYFSKVNPEVPLHIPKGPELNSNSNVYFYIHGWKSESLEAADAIGIKDAIFANKTAVDVVILVDWTEASMNFDYKQVTSESVPKIAMNLANELRLLSENYGVIASNVQMAAHCIGAHIMGQAGKIWNQNGLGPTIKEMTALDAARPGFGDNIKFRISKGDALTVRCIHVGGRLGIPSNNCDEDIYLDTQDLTKECNTEFMAGTCLQKAVKELFKRELTGDKLVNANDLRRGKGRNVETVSHRTAVGVLVLDVSPSMQDNGRLQSLVTSSKRYIKQLSIGSHLGIVLFGGYAYVSSSLQNISNEAIRTIILSEVPKTSTFIFGTSIGAGLKVALNLVSKDLDGGICPDIILITDGEETKKPFHNDISVPECVRVNSIALGNKADDNLEELSRRTSGQMASSSDNRSLDKLTQSMLDISYSRIDAKDRPIRLPSTTLDLNGGNVANFLIDKGVGKDTTVFISTSQYDKVIPKLIDPFGKVKVHPKDFIRDADLEGIYYTIPHAESGKWSLILQSSNRKKREYNHDSQPKATIFITTKAISQEVPITLEGKLSSNLVDYNSKYLPKMEAKVTKGKDVVIGCSIYASIVSPNGVVSTVFLFDNGLGADEERDDGIYSRYVTDKLEMGERYEVSMRASNKPYQQTKIRPISTISSFMPLSASEIERFENAYPFEREISVGSVRAVSQFIQPLPIRVTDLRVVSIDLKQMYIGLNWTAAGNIGDSGTAEAIEMQVFTNFSRNGTIYLINETREGSLKPLQAGGAQYVVVGIPKDLCNEAKNFQLYFAIRTKNTEGNYGEISNVASIAYALSNISEDNDKASSSAIAFFVIFTLTGFAALIYFCLKRRFVHILRR